MSDSGDALPEGVVSEGMDGDYEVLRMEAESSPPISVKNEPLQENAGEELTSSPDSGYGNTPDNPGPGTGEEHLRKIGSTPAGMARLHSDAVNGGVRVREDTQDSACSLAISPQAESAPQLATLGSNADQNRLLSPSPVSSEAAQNLLPMAAHLSGNGRGHSRTYQDGEPAGDSKEGDGVLRERVLNHVHPPSQSVTHPATANATMVVPPSTLVSSTSAAGSRRLRGRTSLSKGKHFSKSVGMQVCLFVHAYL